MTCAFPPSIGGIESMADLLAHEFVAAGHGVEVVASNPGSAAAGGGRPFRVHYQPGPWQRAAIFARCDCILQLGFGLKAIWPNLFTGKPVVVSHQGLYNPRDPATRAVDKLKNKVAGWFANVAASGAVARNLPAGTTVIPNCFDPVAFAPEPASAGVERHGLVCVARLVRDKGVDLLIDAVALLRERGLSPGVTIVGDGPELGPLKEQVANLGLAEQVTFVGPKNRQQVAAEFRRHRVAVVPSRYEEAFGIVALEAMAAGCVVVASDRGGLPEAVGPGGMLFDPAHPASLVDALTVTLQPGGHEGRDPEAVRLHLARHTGKAAAGHYLQVLQERVGTVRRSTH